MRCAVGLLATLTAWAGTPPTASAKQSVRLTATLTPELLGHETTVGFGFRIATPADHVPPPLTGVVVRYPIGLSLGLSELGLATCTARTLATAGPESCPANSVMGYGTALAEIPIGPTIYEETTQLTIVRAPNHNGGLALLIYANGQTPVSAHIVFGSVLLPAAPPFGGRLDLSIPLVPSLPEAPDVAVVRLNATLGPKHLHYHERIHGRIINYEPKGIPLANTCPHSGFRFTAKFAFLDGSHAAASTTVPCPGSRISRSNSS